MKTILATIIFTFFLCPFALAEFSVTPENLIKAYEIPETRSPNGEYALFLINRGETTATFIAFMNINRKSVLAETEILSQGSNAKKYKQHLRTIWSKNSNLVATHDSSLLHSRTHIYKIQKDKIKELKVPDLTAYASTSIRSATTAKSSGQVPIEWLENTTLLITLRFNNKNGNTYTKDVTLKLNNGKTAFEIQEN